MLALGQRLTVLMDEQPPVAEKYNQLLGNAQKNNFDTSKDPGATADMKELFKHLQSPIRKEAVCNALLKMGDKDEVCWEFLSQLGQQIVDSDIPEPYFNDENGNPKAEYLAPDFIEWAKNHNLSASDALESEILHFPWRWVLSHFPAMSVLFLSCAKGCHHPMGSYSSSACKA